jgi:transketolase
MELAENDNNIYLLTGDLGYNVLTPFANRHPDKFINAELQNKHDWK